jgi:hypothetical protein
VSKAREKHFKLTPEILRLNWEMNAACAPFDKWNLPDSHDVIFKVTRDRTTAGYHTTWTDGTHEVGISQRCCGTLPTLTRVMQHEQIHAYQKCTAPKTTTAGVEHNAAFRRLADKVCALHGWDRMEFADADLR